MQVKGFVLKGGCMRGLFYFIVASVLLSVTGQISAFERQRIALFSVTPYGASQSEARLFLQTLSAKLTQSKKIDNIEREQIEKVFEEQKLAISGCTSTECAVKMGELLGAQKILLGTLNKVGTDYFISCRIIDVVLGAIEYETEPIKAKSIDEFAKVADKIVTEIEARVKVLPEIVGFVGEHPVIDIGSDFGVKPGEVFSVIRYTGVVRDKRGRIVFKSEEEIGKIKVTQVQPTGAVCEIIEKTKEIREGDFCKFEKLAPEETKPALPPKPTKPIDKEPPVIKHKGIEFIEENTPLIIRASITDNVGVKSAYLFFRNIKMKDYKKYPFTRKGDLYTVVVDKSLIIRPRVEYYIKAKDEIGNIGEWQNKSAPFRTIVKHRPVAIKKPKKKGISSAKIAFLGISATSTLCGIACAILGEQHYRAYWDSNTPEEGEYHKRMTILYDRVRNISFGVAGVTFTIGIIIK